MQSVRLKFKEALELQNKGKYSKARDLYEEIISLDDRFIPAHNNLGVTFLAMKMYENALKCFERVVALNPMDADAYFNIGKVLSLLGKHEEAVKAFTMAERYRPKDMSIIKNLGNEYISLGEYSKAIVNFEYLIKNGKTDWEVLYFLGLCFYKIKKTNYALAALEKARSYNSTKSSIPLLIGQVLEDSGDLEKAENAYMTAIALSPNSTEILEKTVRFLSKFKKNVKAKSILESYLIDHPYDFIANKLMEEISDKKENTKRNLNLKKVSDKQDFESIFKGFFKSSDWRGGLSHFSSLMNENPENMSICMKTAFFLYKCNEFEKALKIINKYDENNIGRDGLLLKAQIMIELEKYSESKSIIEKLLSYNSLDPMLYYLQGRIEFEQGNINESIINLERALNIEPEMKEANILIGNVYFVKGDILKAHSIFSRMLRIYPDNKKALYFMGFIYYRQREFMKSERMFKRYLTFFPDDYNVLDFLARIYLRMNRTEKAIEAWKIITELSPNSINERILKAKAFFFLEEFELSYKELNFAKQSDSNNAGINYYLSFYYLINNEIGKAVSNLIQSWRMDKEYFKDESIFMTRYFNIEKLRIITSALFDSNYPEAPEIANFFESRIENRKNLC